MATDVVARLRLRAENFSREVRKAFDDVPAVADKAGREAGTRMGEGIGFGLKGALSGIAVGAIVNELAQVTKRAVDYGVELGNNARALNANVEELQAYRQAASEVGIVNKALDDGLQELFESMTEAAGGGKDQAAAFKELGVSLVDANGHARSTTSTMGEVIDKLRAIPDPLAQARLGTEIFGDKWRDMAPLLSAGSDGLRNLTGSILETGDALSTKEIQELNRINAELEHMKTTFEVDFSRIVAANADAIISLGQALGYVVGLAAQAAAGIASFFNTAKGFANIRETEGWRKALTTDFGDMSSHATSAGYINAKQKEIQSLRARLSMQPARGGSLQNAMARASLPRQIAAEERKLAALQRAASARGDFFTAPAPMGNFGGIATITPPKLGGGGGGGARTRGAGGGGVDKEAREREQAAKRLRSEWDRLSQSLDGQIAKQRQAAEIEAIRAHMGDRAAERQKALLDVNEKNARLIKDSGLTKTAEELSKEFGVTIADASAKLDQLSEARRTAVLEIDIKFDKDAAEEAAKQTTELMKREMEAQASLKKEREDAESDRARRYFEDLSSAYFDLFDGNTRNLWDNFKRLGLNALAELAADQTMKLLNGEKGANLGDSLTKLFSAQKGDLIGGMQKGALASSIADAIGIKQSKTGAMAGSAIGTVALGPLGGAIGGLLGGTLGGLLKKTPRGYATIGGEGGDLRIVGAGGNSKDARAQGNKAAGATLTSLDQIAAALGGTYDASRGKVSIGRSGDSWHVDTSGRGKLKKSQGGFDFDDDYEAAVRFATMDLIKDGVLQGISDAAQRILQSGDDIELALEKALMIEEIPKRLKARLDPLGAALDDIDAQFTRLADVLREGGASAEQIAQARQLWELERADAIREIGQASATLRDYLKTLRIGADSPLSLRTQAIEAEAAMAPFVDQIRKAEAARANYDRLAASKAAGGAVSEAELKAAKDAATAAASAVDQSGFRDSAALFLDVARQLGGSTKSFFDQFDRIQGLTNNAIALVENAVPLRGDAKDPFAELTAKSTQAAANILDAHTALLQRIANSIGGVGLGGGGDVFIGGGRGFTNNALR